MAGAGAICAARSAQGAAGPGDARRIRRRRRPGARASKVVQEIRSATAKGGRFAPETLKDLDPLNRLLERDERFSRIVAGHPRGNGSGLELQIDAAVAIAGIIAAADRRSAGAVRLRRGFFPRESVRGTGLHAAVRRPYTRPCAPMVQHGDLRQPRQTGGPSPAPQIRSLDAALIELAEREGFEPPIGLHLCRISSAVHSTTLPPLQAP